MIKCILDNKTVYVDHVKNTSIIVGKMTNEADPIYEVCIDCIFVEDIPTEEGVDISNKWNDLFGGSETGTKSDFENSTSYEEEYKTIILQAIEKLT